MNTLQSPIPENKRIALVAHDNQKDDLLRRVAENRTALNYKDRHKGKD